MPITRRLPDTNITRNRALSRAKKKNDDTPVAERFLSAETQARLNALQPDYKARMLKVDQKQAAALNGTASKNTELSKLLMLDSHFLQVFNFLVAEQKATVGDRAYYGMNANSDAILPMRSEAEVIDATEHVMSGEAERTAVPGATPVPFPVLADVGTQFTAFQNSNTAQSAATEALDTAQEAVAALNTEADAVIKKIWDETETHFNEESIESKRANAREWGVIYISTEAFIVSGTLKVTATGLPPAEGLITLVETGKEGEYVAATGAFTLTTGLTGEGTLHIVSAGLPDKDVVIVLTGDDIDAGEIGLG